MEKQAEDKIFERVRAYVRDQQEEENLQYDIIMPVPIGEISADLKIPEDDILATLLNRIHSGELAGTDVLLTFND